MEELRVFQQTASGAQLYGQRGCAYTLAPIMIPFQAKG
jgi:hypothetical protein